ncbi:hypothetical protein AMAG_18032 [Allomyces macrogynus ATCC 38327]|uniref:Uncharacterized protein n=1 Tax=Allomyces macrogynus (strain ATCC 38327) TaxID=578462 RepID=A0A0L0S4J2_ALLM3|nr:hypothetical protein AMAG_18032 [Allomyces macrogynus ATCC 38327]|eukprot:KNE57294.1 hypothetical protein AMAG_18032 [Allomyces macrogynus ATCC 38327]
MSPIPIPSLLRSATLPRATAPRLGAVADEEDVDLSLPVAPRSASSAAVAAPPPPASNGAAHKDQLVTRAAGTTRPTPAMPSPVVIGGMRLDTRATSSPPSPASLIPSPAATRPRAARNTASAPALPGAAAPAASTPPPPADSPVTTPVMSRPATARVDEYRVRGWEWRRRLARHDCRDHDGARQWSAGTRRSCDCRTAPSASP